MNNKIIFLDVDGPLAWSTWESGKVKINDRLTIPYAWVKEDCDALSEVIKQTDANIVLSSDWRMHFSFRDMKDIFSFYGINPSHLIDYTTMHTLKVKMSSSLEMDRASEIIKWLNCNKVKNNWVAIDDLNLSLGFQYFKYPKYRHVQVDGDWGYGGKMRDKIDDIVRILNRQIMRKRTAKENRFVNYIKKQCKLYGIKCDLRKVQYLKLSGNIKCSGYFDEEEGVLAVAMNREDWIEILAHEYCHLTQWVQNCKEWKNGILGVDKVDQWLSGKPIRNIQKWLGYSRDLELDNEKRTVALIQKWKLDVDIGMYIKKANAYIQFYNYMFYTRKWSSPKNAPYSNEVVIEAMPDTFRMRYKNISKRLLKLYKQENI